MILKLTILVLGVVCLVSGTKKLPDYIKPCTRSDPKFNECVRLHATETLPHILKGDKSFRLPPLTPYKLPLINIDQGDNFKLTLTNCIIDGLQRTTFEETTIDIDKRHATFKGYVPYINVLADYDIKGRILILPIVGNGPANLTFTKIQYKYDLDFDLEKRDGVEYMAYKTSNLAFEPERSYYKLDNLFNGDKRLADEMQRFLFDNWREISTDLNPALAKTVDAVITNILTTIITVVPFDEVFLK